MELNLKIRTKTLLAHVTGAVLMTAFFAAMSIFSWFESKGLSYFIAILTLMMVIGFCHQFYKAFHTFKFSANTFSVKRLFEPTTNFTLNEIADIKFIIGDQSQMSKNIFIEVPDEVEIKLKSGKSERIAFNFFQYPEKMKQLLKAIESNLNNSESIDLSKVEFDDTPVFISLKDELIVYTGQVYFDKKRQYWNNFLIMAVVVVVIFFFVLPNGGPYAGGVMIVKLVMSSIFIGFYTYDSFVCFHYFELTDEELIIRNSFFESRNYKVLFSEIETITISYVMFSQLVRGRSIIITAKNQEQRSSMSVLLKEVTWLNFKAALIEKGIDVEDKILWTEIDLTKVKPLKRW